MGTASEPGTAYVGFGSASLVPAHASIDVRMLDGSDGFALTGTNLGAQAGAAVALGTFDVNNDGIDDLMVGEPGAHQAFVLFGISVDTVDTHEPSQMPTTTRGCRRRRQNLRVAFLRQGRQSNPRQDPRQCPLEPFPRLCPPGTCPHQDPQLQPLPRQLAPLLPRMGGPRMGGDRPGRVQAAIPGRVQAAIREGGSTRLTPASLVVLLPELLFCSSWPWLSTGINQEMSRRHWPTMWTESLLRQKLPDRSQHRSIRQA